LRIIALSDTHCKHREITQEVELLVKENPKAILVHAGDATITGTRKESFEFLEWFSDFKAENKILVPGNHDLGMDKYMGNKLRSEGYLFDFIDKAEESGVKVLINDECNINGFSILGISMIPQLLGWAFYAEDSTIERFVNSVETEYDIIISHSPMLDVLDWSKDNRGIKISKNYGSREFNILVDKCKPKVFISGHIHSSHGSVRYNEYTTAYNVSILNEDYDVEYLVTTIDL